MKKIVSIPICPSNKKVSQNVYVPICPHLSPSVRLVNIFPQTDSAILDKIP